MIMTSPLFVYTTIITVLLVTLLFLVENRLSFYLSLLLLAAYFLLLSYLYRHMNTKNNLKIHKISQYSGTNRPKWLENFQRQAHNVMAQLRAKQSHEKIEDDYLNLDSPYSYGYSSQRRLRTSLKSMESMNQSIGDDNDSHMMMNYYNNSFWRRQLKEVMQVFINNCHREVIKRSREDEEYAKAIENIIKVEKQKLLHAQRIVEEFLFQALRKMIDQAEPKINRANIIVSNHFGKALTNGQTTNYNELSLQQLKNILEFYQKHQMLPQKYKSKYPPEYLHKDMIELTKIHLFMTTLIGFPEQMQPFKILVHILQQEFPSQVIKVNKSDYRFRNEENTTLFTIYSDFEVKMSITNNFRTKNCKKIALLYILNIIKRRVKYPSPLLKEIKRCIG